MLASHATPARPITKNFDEAFSTYLKDQWMDWICTLPTAGKIHFVWGNFEHKTTDLVIEPDSPN